MLADADFIVGTFSKSLGGAGGFCVSDLPVLDLVRYSSRPYIFTASPSPATIASTRPTLAKLSAGRDLRARLRANYERLHAGLAGIGYTLGAPPSPVIAVVLADRSRRCASGSGSCEHGVYVNLMLPPATPDGVSLIRCSVSAAHTDGTDRRHLRGVRRPAGGRGHRRRGARHRHVKLELRRAHR